MSIVWTKARHFRVLFHIFYCILRFISNVYLTNIYSQKKECDKVSRNSYFSIAIPQAEPAILHTGILYIIYRSQCNEVKRTEKICRSFGPRRVISGSCSIYFTVFEVVP